MDFPLSPGLLWFFSKEIAPKCGENCPVSRRRKKRRILSRLWLSWFLQSRLIPINTTVNSQTVIDACGNSSPTTETEPCCKKNEFPLYLVRVGCVDIRVARSVFARTYSPRHSEREVARWVLSAVWSQRYGCECECECECEF